MTVTGTHDTAAPPVAGDASTFPPHAECVRTLLGAGGFATLTTTTAEGYPYGSLAAYSALADGSLLLCLSDMAEHTTNARHDPRAGVLVAAKVDDGRDPLDEPRASVLGELRLHDASADEVERHLSVHPLASAYMEYEDFRWWRLQIVSARFVGGFGSMSWVSGAEVAAAVVDEVQRSARGAIDHMNADHADANLDMVRHLGGLRTATAAWVHAIDRRGVTLYAELPDALHTVRLGFTDAPLASPDEVRAAVVDLARRAREAGTP